MSTNSTGISKDDIALALQATKELSKKEFELKKAKVEIQHEKLQKQVQELEGFKNFKIGSSTERIMNLKIQNREYIDLAKKGAIFLSIDDFQGLVPLFPRNLILVGAETGAGKSTLTANMILQFLRQKRKVLVITNEEHPTDILNRTICLSKGWAYHDHTTITPEQQDEFDRMYPVISQKLEIIDDNYNGVGGLTTTIEGLKTILGSLKEEAKNGEEPYGAIIIDYYQNINTSSKAPGANGFEVLHEVGRELDLFKNIYNSPIILLSQLKAITKEDDSTPFKERIEGRKSVFNFCTCAIEAKADKENSRTEWIFRKSRFSKAMGKTVITGFDKGRYVPYNREFARKSEAEKMERQMNATLAKSRQQDADRINQSLGLGTKEKENAKV